MIFDLLYFKHCPPFHLCNFNGKKCIFIMYALSKAVWGDNTVSNTQGWSVMLYKRQLIFIEKYPWRCMFVYQKRHLTCSYCQFCFSYFSVWYSYWTSNTEHHLLSLQFFLSPKLHDRGASERLELPKDYLGSKMKFSKQPHITQWRIWGFSSII